MPVRMPGIGRDLPNPNALFDHASIVAGEHRLQTTSQVSSWQLAIRHESLVTKLVSMSATFGKDGWYPSVFESIGGLSAEAFAGTPVEKAFMEHTPDAKAFDAYLEKMKDSNITDQDISDGEMRSIERRRRPR